MLSQTLELPPIHKREEALHRQVLERILKPTFVPQLSRQHETRQETPCFSGLVFYCFDFVILSLLKYRTMSPV